MRKFPVWVVKNGDSRIIKELQEKLSVSEFLARLLCQRGITREEEARSFIAGTIGDLLHPYSLPGMAAAVERLEEARLRNEKVLIYGDYDVDGVCSVVLLKEFLDYLGIKNDYYIPNRFSEGYGLNCEAIRQAAQKDYNLVITVDCGIASFREIEMARNLGIDVVVTDHHQPPDKLPPAVALVNPKLGQHSKISELAGAGVVYKLIWAWAEVAAPGYDRNRCLDLVGMATVADIVPLLGENRLLVKAGLDALRATERPGLRALMRESGLTGTTLKTWHIGYVLAPRLNAAGRLGEACLAAELLLTRDPARGEELARFLNEQNRRRQEIETEVLERAAEQVASSEDLDNCRIIVAQGEGWHEGVLGIVASRLTDRWGRPAIVISWDGEYGKGSGRSVNGFDLYEALCLCSHTLERFGGHRYAAGLILERSRFPEFRKEIDKAARSVADDAYLTKRLEVDCEISLEDVNLRLAQELALLEPYGEGNPSPNLLLRRAQICDLMRVGKESEHLKFWIDNGTGRTEAIAFNAKGEAEEVQCGYPNFLVDLVFQPEIEIYNGNTRLVLKVKDMKPSWAPDDLQAQNRTVVTRQVPSLFLTLGQRIKDQLTRGRPVIMIYPTLRCLDRHLLSLQSFLSKQVLVRLDGRVSRQARNEAIRMLSGGECRLFLTTEVFFKYYIKNHALPDRLELVCFVVPERELNDIVDLGLQHLDVMVCSPDWSCFERAVRADLAMPDYDKALFYVNWPNSVDRLCQRCDGLLSEAGLDDIGKRRMIREAFRRGVSRGLVSDGRFGLAFGILPEVKQVFFADPPFGLGEALGFMSQVSGDKEAVFLSFSQEDLAGNQRYLERVFPGAESVNGFLSFHRDMGTSSTAIDKRFLLELSEYLGRKVDATELKAVLRVLSDLEACRIAGNGGKIEVILAVDSDAEVAVDQSLYFQEGCASRQSLLRWVEVCRRARMVV